MKALTADKVQSIYNELFQPETDDKKPFSAKNIRNVHGVLHKALNQAVSCGYIRTNPTDGCVLPRVEKKEIKPLNEVQIAQFIREIRGHPHEYLYRITLFTGLREGEVLGLTWDCVNFEAGTLTIKQQLRREQKKGGQYYFSSTKNGKIRVLALAPSVLELFKAQRQAQAVKKAQAGVAWEEKNHVFSNALGGFLSYHTVYDCYKRIVTKLGVPSARFHDLRH